MKRNNASLFMPALMTSKCSASALDPSLRRAPVRRVDHVRDVAGGPFAYSIACRRWAACSGQSAGPSPDHLGLGRPVRSDAPPTSNEQTRGGQGRDQSPSRKHPLSDTDRTSSHRWHARGVARRPRRGDWSRPRTEVDAGRDQTAAER
jgi:hypothetical protein